MQRVEGGGEEDVSGLDQSRSQPSSVSDQSTREEHTHTQEWRRAPSTSRGGGRRGVLHALVPVEAIEGREPRIAHIAHMGVVRDMPEASLMITEIG
jgi:hypothetical protein